MVKVKLIKRLYDLIIGLSFDYDRMSDYGKEAYDEMYECVKQLIGG